MEYAATAQQTDDSDEPLLTTSDLVRMFEESEESSFDARAASERDRDYHDNIQLTAKELKTLEKRGQPPYIDNRIKTKVDYLVGLEKQQRINPKALPRTPMHDEDADSASQALNYVADKEKFDYKRSQAWRNLLIEGAAGFCVTVKPAQYGGLDVCVYRVAWDRMFWDPHSAEPDFSDASYLGTVQWMDYDDALAMYDHDNEYATPEEVRDAIDATIDGALPGNTFDDKPKFNVWADKKRKRIRICAIWIKRGEDWYFAEFTKGGILKAGPSPHKDDQGNSDCELFFQSAYVDRDNNRFGLVRELIYLQDAINKRNSKALHLLNTTQIVFSKGAVEDPEKARREAARPDGMIEVISVNNGGLDQNFQFNTRSDLAAGQFQLLQENKQAIDLKGPNATQMGEKAQGSAAASGKAIIASQQGGMISLGDLMDSLRHLDLRVFRAIWNRIRQYWTDERWIRVTDDEKNVKWVGVNVDPQRLAYASSEQQQMIQGVIGNVAELDCDITIDESPLSPQAEQSDMLMRAREAGIGIPDIAFMRAMPNFFGKAGIIKAMEEAQKQPNPAQQLQVAGAQAEIAETQASAGLKKAQTMKTVAEARSVGQVEDPRGPIIEAAAKRQESQLKTAQIVQKGRVDLATANAKLRGQELSNVGKTIDLQRQREAPPPVPPQAA